MQICYRAQEASAFWGGDFEIDLMPKKVIKTEERWLLSRSDEAKYSFFKFSAFLFNLLHSECFSICSLINQSWISIKCCFGAGRLFQCDRELIFETSTYSAFPSFSQLWFANLSFSPALRYIFILNQTWSRLNCAKDGWMKFEYQRSCLGWPIFPSHFGVNCFNSLWLSKFCNQAPQFSKNL